MRTVGGKQRASSVAQTTADGLQEEKVEKRDKGCPEISVRNQEALSLLLMSFGSEVGWAEARVCVLA